MWVFHDKKKQFEAKIDFFHLSYFSTSKTLELTNTKIFKTFQFNYEYMNKNLIILALFI